MLILKDPVQSCWKVGFGWVVLWWNPSNPCSVIGRGACLSIVHQSEYFLNFLNQCLNPVTFINHLSRKKLVIFRFLNVILWVACILLKWHFEFTSQTRFVDSTFIARSSSCNNNYEYLINKFLKGIVKSPRINIRTRKKVIKKHINHYLFKWNYETCLKFWVPTIYKPFDFPYLFPIVIGRLWSHFFRLMNMMTSVFIMSKILYLYINHDI